MCRVARCHLNASATSGAQESGDAPIRSGLIAHLGSIPDSNCCSPQIRFFHSKQFSNDRSIEKTQGEPARHQMPGACLGRCGAGRMRRGRRFRDDDERGRVRCAENCGSAEKSGGLRNFRRARIESSPHTRNPSDQQYTCPNGRDCGVFGGRPQTFDRCQFGGLPFVRQDLRKLGGSLGGIAAVHSLQSRGSEKR